MIQIVIGTSHVWAILGHQRGHAFNAALREVLSPLIGSAIREVANLDELAGITVYELMKEFHDKLRELLTAESNPVLTTLLAEIEKVACEDYYLPEFKSDTGNAVNFFALHGLYPHGEFVLKGQRVQAYLPDFSHGARFFGFFSAPAPAVPVQFIDGTINFLWANRYDYELSKIECHLCDTLLEVYNRANSYWHDLKNKTRDGTVSEVALSRLERQPSKQILVIDAVVQGFVGYRSLRRDNPDVPALGRHRLLSAAATRQGMAKPVISGLFPIQLWRQFPEPVHHFLLDAAERVATDQCRPVYPDVPFPDEARALSWQAALAEGDCGFDIDRYAAPLRRLGLETAFRRRKEQNKNLEPSESGKWGWDWTSALKEGVSALYQTDIEQSLHLRNVLDLYPLHKRVLGLIERFFVPRLKARGLRGAASRLWTDAFIDSQSISRPLDRKASYLATLETEGNWLILAKEQSSPTANISLDLASLIDKLVSRLSSAPEAATPPVNLTPASAAEHALQMSRLACTSDPKSVYMTLYLGKLAIMLRNAVEHGCDKVDQDRLLIDCQGYWEEERKKGGGEYLKILKWDLNCAEKVRWRRKSDLPREVPAVANRLALTKASLRRCLTLLSLVLHAGNSHLR